MLLRPLLCSEYSAWRRSVRVDRRWPRLRHHTLRACRPRAECPRLRQFIRWGTRRRSARRVLRSSGPWPRCRARGGHKRSGPRAARWVTCLLSFRTCRGRGGRCHARW